MAADATGSPARDEPEPVSSWAVHDGRLVPEAGSVPRLAVLIHDQLRATLLSAAFPCLGGASAVRRAHYRFGVYGAMDDERSRVSCARDVRSYIDHRPGATEPVSVFVAAFPESVVGDEDGFERDLWTVLRSMSPDAQATPCPRDDPGFFFAGREFFVVGLHPTASRWARRFAWPVLVFNALSHSELLQVTGKADRMRERVLTRDRELQGFDNPSLEASQLAQFSGRAVADGWKAPS